MPVAVEIDCNDISLADTVATFPPSTSFPPDEKKLGKSKIIKDPTYYFYANFVVFEVERRLFRVPTHLFVQESPSFSEIYKLGSYEQSFQPHSVIKLNGIGQNDFKCLLKVLYPLNISLKVELTINEWISVLSISSEWRFLRLREMAIAELGILNSVEKIRLGRELYISSWIVDGLSDLVLRTGTIIDEEAIKIDASAVGTVYKLYRLRELRIANKYSAVSMKSKVEETFKDELARIIEKEKEYQVIDEEKRRLEEIAALKEAEDTLRRLKEEQQRKEELDKIKQKEELETQKKEQEQQTIRKKHEEAEREKLERLQRQISNTCHAKYAD